MSARARGRHPSDERGVVLPLVAVAMVAALAATALSVDLGRIATRRRDLQAVADMIVLDAAATLAGQTLGELETSAVVVDSARSTAARNAFLTGSVTSTVGRAAADGTFVAGGAPVNAWRLAAPPGDASVVVVLGSMSGGSFVPASSPTDVPLAVLAEATDRIPYHFRPGAPLTSRSAAAVAVDTAGVGIRTGLASLQPSLTNHFLGQLLGSTVSVSSYDGLAGATVTLARIRAELGLGTLHELLDAQLEVGRLLQAQAAVLRREGAAAAADVLDGITFSTGAPTVRLADLVAVQPGGEAAAAEADLDVALLLTATAALAGRDNAVSVDGTALGVPELAGVPISLRIVEPPQFAFGPAGITVRSAQVTFDTTPTVHLETGNLFGDKCQLVGTGLVDDVLVSSCLLLQDVVAGDLAAVVVDGSLTTHVALAHGTATLAAIDCAPAPAERRATVGSVAGGGAAVQVSGSLTASVTLLGDAPATPLAVGVAASPTVAPTTGGDVPFGAGGTAFGEWTAAAGADLSTLAVEPGAFSVTGSSPVRQLVVSDGSTPEQLQSLLARRLAVVVQHRLRTAFVRVAERLDATLGLGIASAEVTVTPPNCSGSRLVV